MRILTTAFSMISATQLCYLPFPNYFSFFYAFPSVLMIFTGKDLTYGCKKDIDFPTT